MNLNLGDSVYSEEDVISALSEAQEASEDLRQQLAAVRIIVKGANNPDTVMAIKNIFGDQYINNNGDSYITYDMYCTILNLLRTLGTQYTASTL